MALNIIKLCVGAASIEDLAQWQKERLREQKARGETPRVFHGTLQTPKRKAELKGGSLYWVIKGVISCRQKLIDLRPFSDKEGIKRCRIVMEPKLVTVMPKPRSAFQGWRYLKANEAPADLAKGAKGADAMSEDMRRQLNEMGLL